jgi:hypothetical protein
MRRNLQTILANQKALEKQQEIQAYSNWQNFLALAVNNAELANGLDSIRGKNGIYYLIRDSSSRDRMKKDTLAHNQYVKYAWFVAYAVGSAESVYKLQNSDPAWKNTLIEALRGHQALFDAKIYDLNSYDTGFSNLIQEAFQSKEHSPISR